MQKVAEQAGLSLLTWSKIPEDIFAWCGLSTSVSLQQNQNIKKHIWMSIFNFGWKITFLLTYFESKILTVNRPFWLSFKETHLHILIYNAIAQNNCFVT